MATPAFQIQNVSATIRQESAQELDFGIARDAAGAPVDISSGYTAQMVLRLSQQRDQYGPIVFGGTFVLGSTGSVKMQLTQAQSNQAPVGNWGITVRLSNDGGTTYSTHGVGQATVQPGY